jgi:hypothetical protein
VGKSAPLLTVVLLSPEEWTDQWFTELQYCLLGQSGLVCLMHAVNNIEVLFVSLWKRRSGEVAMG